MIILQILHYEQVVFSCFHNLVGPLQFVQEYCSVYGSSRLDLSKNCGSCSPVCTGVVVVAEYNSTQRSVTATAELNHPVFNSYFN